MSAPCHALKAVEHGGRCVASTRERGGGGNHRYFFNVSAKVCMQVGRPSNRPFGRPALSQILAQVCSRLSLSDSSSSAQEPWTQVRSSPNEDAPVSHQVQGSRTDIPASNSHKFTTVHIWTDGRGQSVSQSSHWEGQWVDYKSQKSVYVQIEIEIWTMLSKL